MKELARYARAWNLVLTRTKALVVIFLGRLAFQPCGTGKPIEPLSRTEQYFAARDGILLVMCTCHFGGAERSFYGLAEGLTHEHRFSPLFVVFTSNALLLPKEGKVPSTLYQVAALPCRTWNPVEVASILLGILRAAMTIGILAKERGAVIVHANGIKSVFPSMLASAVFGLKLVWHVRDYPRGPVVHRVAEKWSSAVLSPSEFILHALGKFSKPQEGKHYVISNPIPSAGFHWGDSEGVLRDGVTFLMVAQIVPWKRQDLFIDAAALLAPRYPNARFLHLGSDISGRNANYAAALKRKVEKAGLKDKFTFLGYLPDAAAAIESCDILVLPSQHEPFGRVIVEAWLAAKSVIVSDCGGPSELVTHRHNGLVFRSGDATELGACMEQLFLDRSLRIRLGAEGASATSRFSIENHTREVVRVYERVLA